MKRWKLWRFTVAVLVLVWGVWGVSWGHGPDDRSLSPYFFIQSDDEAADPMPLKATSVSVVIAGVIADVTVTQVYKNEGARPIEALYVFPGSTRAAVYGMTMTIGKRVVVADIARRAEARRIYEEARDAGKNAALLEQQRPNVFQMQVANILPGDEIRVELKYTELLVPTDRVYEFVYPTVVGPRYIGSRHGDTGSSAKWAANPYLKSGKAPAASFDLTVSLLGGMPIRDIRCTSHTISTVFEGKSKATLTLNPKDPNGTARDFILRYRLAGDQIASGLLLHEGVEENFFVLMVQPPKTVVMADIPGREYIFVIDVSGSMYGFPLEVVKKLLAELIGSLRPTDTFNVLLFSGGSTLMAPASLPATQANIKKALSVIDAQRGGGGTELLPAMRHALSLPRRDGVSRSVVVVTDGYVTVEEEVFDLIRDNLGQANLFAFGIGSSVNRHLIEGMARVGQGEPFILTGLAEAQRLALQFRKMVERPVLAQVRVSFSGFDAYDVEPKTIPDVLAQRPVIVYGKWRGRPTGRVTVEGVTGAGPFSTSLRVDDFRPKIHNEALKYLWARHRIALLSDYNQLRGDAAREEEITKLGLIYNLLTAYTSFVAVDSEVRPVDGKPVLVRQPLLLPEGVSEVAVAGRVVRGLGAPGRHFETMDLAPAVLKHEKGETSGAFQVAQLSVSPGGKRQDVWSAVQRQMDSLEACIGKNRSPVTVTLHLTVGKNGVVKAVRVESEDIHEKRIRQCLAETLKTWLFPKGTRNDVNVTLVLTRAL